MNDLISNIDRVHTTDMGALRVRRNMGFASDMDVVAYCRQCILSPGVIIVCRGKNCYITTSESIITVNAHSFTIITAHRNNKK